MLKNTIIAALVTFIYHSYIVEGTSGGTKAYAVVIMFVAVLAIMQGIDSVIRKARYKKVHMLKKKSFDRYKNWMAGVVEKKAAGKDETHRKKIIMSIITHQKKYALSGKQIQQLLSLAKEIAERSAEYGPRKRQISN